MSRHLKNYVATRAATRLVMDAAQSEKARAGRVTMPKVFFVIGIIGFVLLATATFLCGRIPHMIGLLPALLYSHCLIWHLLLHISISAYIIQTKCLSIKTSGASSDCTDMRISPVYA